MGHTAYLAGRHKGKLVVNNHDGSQTLFVDGVAKHVGDEVIEAWDRTGNMNILVDQAPAGFKRPKSKTKISKATTKSATSELKSHEGFVKSNRGTVVDDDEDE